MSFSFNFNINENCENGLDDKEEVRCVADLDDDVNTEGKDVVEVQVDWDKLCISPQATELICLSHEESLCVVASNKVILSEDSDIAKAAAENSDLIPHVYEGGLKIWECSVDLAKYLSSLQIAFRGMRVLEVGCGAALPGIVAYKRGADVTLQDYNTDVLTLITAPNVVLNTPEKPAHRNLTSQCRLLAGDWARVQKTLTQENLRYDLILTSETIYSCDSYKKLHDVMAALLDDNGTIYLAAKTYYFGVGGGTRDFEQYLDKRGVFKHEVCKEYADGVKREILKLQFSTSGMS